MDRCWHTSASRPQRTLARETLARTGCLAGILASYLGAPGAPVAAPAPAASLFWHDHMAGQHRTLGLNVLPDDIKAEPLKAGERGQVRASQGSVGYAEVSRAGWCSNP